MKVLAIIEARTITGPAKNLLEFARVARGRDVQTEVATFVRGEESNLFLETARRTGIEAHGIPETGPLDRAAWAGLQTLVTRVRPDVVQTHAVKGHLMARLSGLPRLAPWVAFHHGYTSTDRKVKAYNELDRFSLRKARRVVTVSEPFARELQKRGVERTRIRIIHNAIRADWGRMREGAEGLRAKLRIGAGDRVVLSVGRLSAEKDHATLLRAFATMRDKAVLVIVGDGPERGAIEVLARDLGIAERVRMAGQQPSAEPYYGIADLVVLTSTSEGSPNALLEGMACGVPVVATAVGGIPEMVTDGDSAVLTRVGDIGGIARAMDKVLGDDGFAAALAARAHRLIVERYTPEERAARLISVYREVLDS